MARSGRLGAPAPIEWFWGQSPWAVGLESFVLVWLMMYLIANTFAHGLNLSAYSFSQWHAFNWGDGICIPAAFTLMSVAATYWHGSHRFYVSHLWYVGWMIVGVIVTILNALNDRNNATSWKEVVSNPWAPYHIVMIAVFVTLGGCISGVVLCSHPPILVGMGIAACFAGYVSSVLLDDHRKRCILAAGHLLSNHY